MCEEQYAFPSRTLKTSNKLKHHNFAYQMDRGFTYGSPSHEHVYSLLQGAPHIYEVTGANSNSIKLFFDIDNACAPLPCDTGRKRTIQTTVITYIKGLLRFMNVPSYACECIVLNGSTEKKLSLHLIFPHIRFANHDDMKEFVIALSAFYTTPHIDRCVYTKTRLFRVCGAYKIGKRDGILRPHARVTCSNETITYTLYKPGYTNLELFKETLVSSSEQPTNNYCITQCVSRDDDTTDSGICADTAPPVKKKRKCARAFSHILPSSKTTRTNLMHKQVHAEMNKYSTEDASKHEWIERETTFDGWTIHQSPTYKWCSVLNRNHKSNTVIYRMHPTKGAVVYCHKCNHVAEIINCWDDESM